MTTATIVVDKTCSMCGTFYHEWDRSKIDGETSIGVWFTCRAMLPDSAEVCGSTLLHPNQDTLAKLRLERLRTHEG